jgi:hypothetical protein
LAGLDLELWSLCGESRDRPLFLRGANFAGACLDLAQLEHVDLAEANLTGAFCQLALFQDVNFRAGLPAGADFTGATLRQCTAEGLRGSGARWYDADWICSDLRGADLGGTFELDGTLAVCQTAPGEASRPAELPTALEAVIRDAHHGPVHCCAWSPDGRRLLSGSDDQTLRVWDAESGNLLLTCALVGPGETAALDPQSQRILWASPGAGRYLGWRVRDPQTDRLRILPAEFFGPLRG